MKFFRRRNTDDFSNEVRAHLEHEEAELRAAGLSAEDARAEARRRFGNVTLARERVYEASRFRLLETLWQDVRYGARLMRRSPAFSITAVVVLSLGIGVNTALFSIVNGLFFKPLPVHAPQELFYMYDVFFDNRVVRGMDQFRREFFRDHGASLADFTHQMNAVARMSIDGDTESSAGEHVGANYFELLGVRPARGRAFRSEDEDPANTEHPVVISQDLWMRRFNGDREAMGRTVRLNEQFYQVVGVAPPGFTGLSDPWRPSEFWILSASIGRGPRAGGIVGRLKSGVSFEQMAAFVRQKTPEVRELVLGHHPNARRQFPDWLRAGTFPLHRAVDVRVPSNPDARIVPANVLAGTVSVVALVLLVATANLAGLLLARGVTRTGEVAVRRALGAGGGRLARQLLTESVLFSTAGGVLGFAVAASLLGVFRANTPWRLAVDLGFDWRVLLFAVGVCAGAGVLVGLAPVRQAARVHVLEALASGIVGARAVRARLRHSIVIPQVALSVVLLVAAAVHVRALARLDRDPGYLTEGPVIVTYNRWEPAPSPDELRRRTPEDVAKSRVTREAIGRAFTERVLERVADLPQARAVAAVRALPGSGGGWVGGAYTSHEHAMGAPARARAARHVVSPGVFDATGIRLLVGRPFDARDARDGVKTAILSEGLARALWPAGQAVGETMVLHSTTPVELVEVLEVVGVVNDTEPLLVEGRPTPTVYVPLAQQSNAQAWQLVVRGDGDRATMMRDVKAAVVGADALAEVTSVRTMEQTIADALYPRRLAAAILSAAGLIGLLLACIGLYGVVSYSIAQRMREIGIRTTLGAERGDIIALVLREAGRVSGVGIVAGLALAVPALRWSAGIVRGVPAIDVASLVVVPTVLALVVIAACVGPALRAARVDPAQVLRAG